MKLVPSPFIFNIVQQHTYHSYHSNHKILSFKKIVHTVKLLPGQIFNRSIRGQNECISSLQNVNMSNIRVEHMLQVFGITPNWCIPSYKLSFIWWNYKNTWLCGWYSHALWNGGCISGQGKPASDWLDKAILHTLCTYCNKLVSSISECLL